MCIYFGFANARLRDCLCPYMAVKTYKWGHLHHVTCQIKRNDAGLNGVPMHDGAVYDSKLRAEAQD